MYKLFVGILLVLLSACSTDLSKNSGADNPPIINPDDREQEQSE